MNRVGTDLLRSGHLVAHLRTDLAGIGRGVETGDMTTLILATDHPLVDNIHVIAMGNDDAHSCDHDP